MGDLVNFPRHKMYHCGCGEGDCPFCAGGLGLCVRCNGFEATMPEDCPGHMLSDEQLMAIQDGKLDFRRKLGGWTTWSKQKEDRVRFSLL